MTVLGGYEVNDTIRCISPSKDGMLTVGKRYRALAFNDATLSVVVINDGNMHMSYPRTFFEKAEPTEREITLLAACRDAFPMPEPGAPLEQVWMAAMGDPEEVVTYMEAIAQRLGRMLALAVPVTASMMQDVGGGKPYFCVMAAYRTKEEAEAAMAVLVPPKTNERPTPPAPGERCQHCIDRRDGFYGSWAPDCPFHNEDGSLKKG